jgi:hypothetical protein
MGSDGIPSAEVAGEFYFGSSETSTATFYSLMKPICCKEISFYLWLGF